MSQQCKSKERVRVQEAGDLEAGGWSPALSLWGRTIVVGEDELQIRLRHAVAELRRQVKSL